MTNATLLLTIFVALPAMSGLIRLVARRRRAARSLITTSPHAGTARSAQGAEPISSWGGHAEPSTETDAERRERLVEQAFLAGAVPAVWYRHAKAALAAEAAEADHPRR